MCLYYSRSINSWDVFVRIRVGKVEISKQFVNIISIHAKKEREKNRSHRRNCFETSRLTQQLTSKAELSCFCALLRVTKWREISPVH